MGTYPQQLYTVRKAFEAICLGERPWTALGNFMNAWWGYGKEQREELVKDPLPHDYPEQYHHWAAFCAASADWFATTYDVPRPQWVDDPKYVLKDPWYFEKPKSLWPRLRKETLPEFCRRNIFCGDRVYANKWEYPLGRMKSKHREAWDLTVTPSSGIPECSRNVNNPGARPQMLPVRQTQHKSRSNGGKSKKNVCKPLLLSIASTELPPTICAQERTGHICLQQLSRGLSFCLAETLPLQSHPLMYSHPPSNKGKGSVPNLKTRMKKGWC